jgi:DNA-binding NarL/FixJ family response regulator
MATKILIADHQRVFRNFLRRVLQTESDFQVVGEASDGMEVLRLAETLKPDLVVMDLDMPQGGGLYTTRQIKNRAPQTMVLLLSSLKKLPVTDLGSGSGFDAFLSKDVPVPEIFAAVWGLTRRSSGSRRGN